jgi:GNAT superfamily N-acetyltransferase
MPEIRIRPAVAGDISHLISLDHDYVSDTVWQMDVTAEENHVGVSFRQVRLPRSVRVDYPRPPRILADEWSSRALLLVALLANEPVGYISSIQGIAPATNWVTDLVVTRRVRRQGVGTTLILAAQEWARQFYPNRMVIEMQPKNYPAICLVQKLGFDFCGYNDRYYLNHDIALFFSKMIRG